MRIKLEVLAVSVRCACISLAAAWALAVSFPLHAQYPAPTADPPARQFSVKTVHIQGNTLLPEKEVQAIVAPLVGNERTLIDLDRATAALQQAYRKAGYGGVVVFVPEQELSGGEIVLLVVEGKLANVEIL